MTRQDKIKAYIDACCTTHWCSGGVCGCMGCINRMNHQEEWSIKYPDEPFLTKEEVKDYDEKYGMRRRYENIPLPKKNNFTVAYNGRPFTKISIPAECSNYEIESIVKRMDDVKSALNGRVPDKIVIVPASLLINVVLIQIEL